MKGIILASGIASRLFPITLCITKQLLPIYDKPMIYYPISTLMMGGIQDIVIIVSPNQMENFINLLGDGSQFGVNISYRVQKEANGLPEAFVICEDYIKDNNVALILGDNIFYGQEFNKEIEKDFKNEKDSTVFLYNSLEPERFGVAEISKNGKLISIEEKPKNPKSNYIVTGLYIYDKNVSYYSKSLRKSLRGETEISDLNNIYIKEGKLNYKILNNKVSWFDTGTTESLFSACNYVRNLYETENVRISVLEEIAYKNKWITYEQVLKQSIKYKNSSYGKYLNKIILK